MHILYLTDYFYPEVTAGAYRAYEHAKVWKQQGDKVTVLTSIPNFPFGKHYPGYESLNRSQEELSGVKVIRIPTYMAPNEGVYRRTIDFLSYGVSSVMEGVNHRPDVILASSPHLFTTGAGYILSRLLDVPWVFELRDLWPESIQAVGALNNSSLIKWLTNYEMFLYHHSQLIVCNTEGLQYDIVSRGIDVHKTLFIPNGVDINAFDIPDWKKTKKISTELGLENKFVVGYIGTIGMAHGLDFIVKAVSELETKGVHLLLIGEGAEKEPLKKLVATRQINNVTFVDNIPKRELMTWYDACDIALVNLKKHDTFTKSLPSKIFDIGACKKPILLGIDGEARSLIEKFEAGIYFEPENEIDFHEKINYCMKNPHELKKMSENAYILAGQFRREDLAIRMRKSMHSLI